VGNESCDVFVSYSRADWRHAADFDSVLRSEGLKPFFDRRNLAPGLPWVPALEQAIGAAKAAIVLIGPRGLGNTKQCERDLALVRQTHEAVPRCLTAAQRAAYFLQPEPPHWCIELAKWPYRTDAWKQWFSDIRAGQGPPLSASP